MSKRGNSDEPRHFISLSLIKHSIVNSWSGFLRPVRNKETTLLLYIFSMLVLRFLGGFYKSGRAEIYDKSRSFCNNNWEIKDSLKTAGLSFCPTCLSEVDPCKVIRNPDFYLLWNLNSSCLGSGIQLLGIRMTEPRIQSFQRI